MLPAPKLLLVDADPLLLPLRRKRLVQAGFDVTGAAYASHAQRMFAHESFDAVILAHTLPADERELLAETLRKLKPRIRLLLLYAGDETVETWADGQADGLAAPEDLIEGVRQLLRQNGKWARPGVVSRCFRARSRR